jgi:hypothetical protein
MPEETTKQVVTAEVVDRDEPTTDLIREALDETRELVRLEVALAREELKGELTQAKTGGFALGSAASAGIAAFTMFMVTIALAFSMKWLAALIIAGILLALACALGLGGWKLMPKQPLGATRERIGSDLKQLKERVA